MFEFHYMKVSIKISCFSLSLTAQYLFDRFDSLQYERVLSKYFYKLSQHQEWHTIILSLIHWYTTPWSPMESPLPPHSAMSVLMSVTIWHRFLCLECGTCGTLLSICQHSRLSSKQTILTFLPLLCYSSETIKYFSCCWWCNNHWQFFTIPSFFKMYLHGRLCFFNTDSITWLLEVPWSESCWRNDDLYTSLVPPLHWNSQLCWLLDVLVWLIHEDGLAVGEVEVEICSWSCNSWGICPSVDQNLVLIQTRL